MGCKDFAKILRVFQRGGAGAGGHFGSSPLIISTPYYKSAVYSAVHSPLSQSPTVARSRQSSPSPHMFLCHLLAVLFLLASQAEEVEPSVLLLPNLLHYVKEIKTPQAFYDRSELSRLAEFLTERKTASKKSNMSLKRLSRFVVWRKISRNYLSYFQTSTGEAKLHAALETLSLVRNVMLILHR